MSEASPSSAKERQSNPFDLEALRSLPNLEDSLVERVLVTVPARRPGKTEFFRVHPDPAYMIDAYTLEHSDGGFDRAVYWVAPDMRPYLTDYLRPTRLLTCVNKSKVHFLWPAKLPAGSGQMGRSWHMSALVIAEEAKTRWVRMRGNRELGAYELHVARGDYGEPVWPEKTFGELIELAFKERVIDSPDHPVVQELEGLA